MFFVAFCCDWCATVPACWILVRAKILKWPLKPLNPRTECKKSTKPAENWDNVAYTHLVGPFDTYEEARIAELCSVDISTNDEEPLEDLKNVPAALPQKRHTRKPSQLEDYNEDDMDEDDKLIYAPPTLKWRGSPLWEILEPPSGYEREADQDDSAKRMWMDTDNASNDESIDFHDDTDWNRPATSSVTLPFETMDIGATSARKQYCSVCGSVVPQILAALDDLTKKVDILLMHVTNSEDRNSAEIEKVIFPFPMGTMQALNNVNNILANDRAAHEQNKKMIKNVNVKDQKKHCRQVLGMLLSDSFACKLSWTGQKQTVRIKEMKFVNLLIETI